MDNVETVTLPASRWPRSLVSGSPLYLLSALCILYGISRILAPYYKDEIVPLREKLACLGAINVYELSLLAALGILLWRRVLDDALSLTVLIAIFLVASAMTLDVAAVESPKVFVLVGAAGLALAMGKLWLASRHMIGRLNRWMIVALVMLGVWNFLMPGAIAWALAADVRVRGLTKFWAEGWWMVLCAGAVMTAGILSLPGESLRKQPGAPLLGSAVMRWVFVLLIWAGSVVHAWGQTWAFHLRAMDGDMLPAVVILAMALVALRHALTPRHVWADAVIAGMPMVVAMMVIGSRHFAMGPASGPGVVSYPPLVLIAGSAMWGLIAARVRSRGLLMMAVAYLLLGALTYGVAARPSNQVVVMHWDRAGAMACAAILMLTVFWRTEAMAYASVVCAAIGITMWEPVTSWMRECDVAMLPMLMLLAGIGAQMVHRAFRNERTQRVALGGSVLMAIALIYLFMRPGTIAHLPMQASLIAVLLGALMAIFFRREAWIAAPLLVPLFVGVFQATPSAGWNWIIVSFMLLGLGVAVSLIRGGMVRMQT